MQTSEVNTSSPGETTAPRIAWAVMLIAMSLLALELVVTRIFSVILWNHFAFLAISVGLFGFGVAGVLVYVMPRVFTRERAYEQVRQSALFLVPVMWAVIILLCALPIRMDFSTAMFGSDDPEWKKRIASIEKRALSRVYAGD